MTKSIIENNVSGMDWMGAIPNGWSASKIAELYTYKKERSDKEEELLSVYRDYGVIPKSSRDDNHNQASEDLSNYILIEQGDLVINKMKAWQGSVAISQFRGIVSPAYFSYRITSTGRKKLFLPYFHHLLRSKMYIETYRRISNGIRPGQWDLDPYQFKILPVFLPPTETQKRIADFLDAKTKTIDELVVKKERMAELLKEKRAAIITRVVTKGLDPKAKFKPSGVEWLGSIPENWDILPARALLRDRREKNKKLVSDNILSVMRGKGVIRYEDKGNVGNKSSDNPENYKIVYPGDIVINSMNLVIGSVGISNELGVTSSVYIIYYGVQGISLTDYYHNVFLIEGLQRHLGKFGKGIMELREAVKHGDIKNQFFPHPPIKEQREIADYLAVRISKIDSVVTHAESQIEKLKEYRSSLIYSAVTGKIKI